MNQPLAIRNGTRPPALPSVGDLVLFGAFILIALLCVRSTGKHKQPVTGGSHVA